MEMAYHDNDSRELELTCHVSLRQLDPLALLTLKSTSTCTVTFSRWLYDQHCPGHDLRRIKSVPLSIPSVVGPYSSINCTLSLLRSSMRKSPTLTDGEYARQGADDDRFVDYIGAVQTIYAGAGNACRKWGIVAACGMACGRIDELEPQEGVCDEHHSRQIRGIWGQTAATRLGQQDGGANP
jgi:hypothetical protein